MQSNLRSQVASKLDNTNNLDAIMEVIEADELKVVKYAIATELTYWIDNEPPYGKWIEYLQNRIKELV